MKKLIITLVLAAMPAFGSTVKDYDFTKLSKLSAEELESFNFVLAQTLNVLQRCDAKSRAQFDFGQKIKSLHFSSSRSGQDTFRIEASGSRPAPSFRPYDVTIEVDSQLVKETGPVAANAPPRRTYTCKVLSK
jgi:hypothetical protein